MKIKRIFSSALFFTVFFIFSSFLYGMPADSSHISPEMKNILNRGKLIVAIPDVDDTIFFTKSDKPLKGFEIENAEKLAKTLGVGIEFNRDAKTFNEVVDVVAQGKADVAISDLSRNLTRAKKILYSKPYITYHTALLVNRTWLAKENVNNNPKKPAPVLLETGHYTIGTLEGTSNVDVIKDIFPKAKTETFATADNLYQAIREEKINVVLYDDFFIKRILFEDPSLALRYKIIILEDYPDYICMAVAINHSHFLQWLNIYIDSRSLNLNSDDLIEYYMKHRDDF